MCTVLRNAVGTLGSLEMDAFNRLEIDPLNRLVGFRSTIHLKKVPQAIVIEGTIEGTRLKLHIDAGEVSYTPSDHYLPQDAHCRRRAFAASEARRLACRPNVDRAGL